MPLGKRQQVQKLLQ